MAMIDTHIAAALYQGKPAGLSRRALAMIDREPLTFSPAVLLELELLHEIGRLRHGATIVARVLADTLSIHCASDGFADVARQALDIGFTHDPFDRLIVAHAALRREALSTQDSSIQRYYPSALA